MNRPDPHSYFDLSQPRTERVRLRLAVDFKKRELRGDCTLYLDRAGAGQLDLDTKSLVIEGVSVPGIAELPFDLGPEEPILGRRLRIHLPPGAREVTVRYRTTRDSVALQWLAPEQTAGGTEPFLFSQCQSIHARTVAPLQDCPLVRIRYEAELLVPRPLTAVMSAAPGAVEPQGNARLFRFEMPQAIPPYLLALAIGELESRDLSPRARVWAEPSLVEAAAIEFGEVESMIVQAEALFGPYDWDRFDMLVLPPSFPYGGMENPRMTFLTPTLLAGDRSLVDVVIHELAHSWTGNLISNANAEHFWLNEGFTVYGERRIVEATYGREVALQHWALGDIDLDGSITRLGADSPLTRLRQELQNVDPDDAYSTVPYEKGARLLYLLEQEVGRERFDLFIRAYIAKFRFTSITTEEFGSFVEAELPGAGAAAGMAEWLTGVGMPSNRPQFRSARMAEIVARAERCAQGERPSGSDWGGWSRAERSLFLDHLPGELDASALAWLDQGLGLGTTRNYELLVAYLRRALRGEYEPAFPRAREVMSTVGRMKYLRPLYQAAGAHPRTRELAREVFATAAGRYHSLSRRVVEETMAGWVA